VAIAIPSKLIAIPSEQFQHRLDPRCARQPVQIIVTLHPSSRARSTIARTLVD